MFDFVVTLPFLKYCIKGCHGNRAFSHRTNRFILGETFFRIGYPREQCGTNEKLSWVGAR